MNSCLDLARDYVRAFCRGDTGAMTELLAEDFVIEGPLYRFDTATAFIQRLKQLNPPTADYEVVAEQGDGDRASLFFRYQLGPLEILMAMNFIASNGLLTRALLVFDTAKLPKR